MTSAQDIKNLLVEKADFLEKQLKENPEDADTLNVASKRDLLPEFSLDARLPEQIYKLNSIISQDEWDNIPLEELKKILKKPHLLHKENKFYVKYVLAELLRYTEAAPKTEATGDFKLRCLLYLNMLFKFLSVHNVFKTLQELSSEMKMNIKCVKSVVDKFYLINLKDGDNAKFVRNSMLIDKIMCHIIILALMIHNYEMNGTVLQTALKLDSKKFIKYCEEIGCLIRKRKKMEKKHLRSH